MNISIPGYSETSPTKFNIQISINQITYNVSKRYSEFEAFNNTVEQEMNEKSPVELPAKKWVGNKNRDFLEDRRRKLEIYLRSMMKREEWRESLAFQQFLEVSKHIHKGKTNNNTGEWTKKVTETKEFIQRASQANGKGGAEERKYVVMAGAKIKDLESHLVGNQQTLGDGEYRRRKDLVHELSRNLLNVTKAASPSTHSIEKPTSNSSSTLNHVSSGSRVLGGVGGSETDRTRDVNNSGLMEQQKDDMSQQDEMIQMLRATIQRQKQLGEDINEEIEGQNKLLDELDSDTHFTSSRLNQAKKRVSKFT